MTIAIDRAVYSQLLVKYQPKVIETEEEYNQAFSALLELMKRQDRSREETELLKLLTTLIKEFDEKQPSPEPASPHEVLGHLMEENGLKLVDLVGQVGSLEVVSEIINGKRSPSLAEAKILAEKFHVSPAVFI
jgi:HTH-type transcriptional regulator/antitoxin HigA